MRADRPASRRRGPRRGWRRGPVISIGPAKLSNSDQHPGVDGAARRQHIYNLALSGYGVGRYEVVMRIGGNDSSYDVSSPAYFGLR